MRRARQAMARTLQSFVGSLLRRDAFAFALMTLVPAYGNEIRDEIPQRTGCVRSTGAPRRITDEIRRVLVMLSNGFASRTMKSALIPASSVPESVIRTKPAEFRVAATMTCIGVIPATTMS